MLKFSPPPPDCPPADESEYSVFTTASSRSVEAPALWSRDRVAKKACQVDDRRVVKDAGSFGDSTLTRFFPLVEEDETLLKVLEVGGRAIKIIRPPVALGGLQDRVHGQPAKNDGGPFYSDPPESGQTSGPQMRP